MRLTPRLCAQHLGWTFKKHWQSQGKRIPRDTGAANELAKVGIIVKDPKEVLNPKKERQRFVIDPDTQVGDDETNYQWHQQKCYVYSNENVLLEGMSQAQVLTKTIRVNGLPKPLTDMLANLSLPSTIDQNILQSILASTLLDAEQVVLPKIKSDERPAFNFPRQYGISQYRQNRLLINRLLTECEKIANPSITSQRRVIDNADFTVSVPKDEDLIQLDLEVHKLVTANKAIEPIKGKFESDIPNMYPLKCTTSIPLRNTYCSETRFPLSNRINCSHPHTIFTFFNKENVRNIHGSNVSNAQFQSRTLLSAFAVAAARAKQLYGDASLEHIPKPIVIQSIQTDGRTFHFGVFQLNTLNLGENSDARNYWFQEENMHLFTHCAYKCGQPVLEGYDKKVFRYLNAFYHNM
ncbi:large ribosomal subunit protein mL37 [Stomoxys calcitrans]|uniref:large ribosomal subunit protein mL37 n=1 Tax=Stomoxys calcitrans TaxID=35570 RepID=UPI0027E2D46A|nr:large ribosomal subunit protein mL37 [Stomoxys calcitrans]